jgi:hypothetical protein
MSVFVDTSAILAFHFDRHFQEQGFEFPRLA